MLKIEKRRLFLKFLTLEILIVGLVFLFYRENFAQYLNAHGQQATVPVVSVLPQPDAPLRISVLTSDSTNPQTPELVFQLTNISGKPVRAYTVREETRKGAQQSASSILADMDSTNSILQPGQYTTDSITYEPLSEVISQVTLSIDMVEFTDGATWGANVSKSSELLAGRRAGAREGNKRVLQVYKADGLQAVVKLLEAGSTGITPPAGNSSEWQESFVSGYGSTARRLKRILDRDGIKQLETEVRKLSDKSVRGK